MTTYVGWGVPMQGGARELYWPLHTHKGPVYVRGACAAKRYPASLSLSLSCLESIETICKAY